MMVCSSLTRINLNASLPSRVLVLDKGEMVEFDSPSNLISRRGAFFQMALDAGLV